MSELPVLIRVLNLADKLLEANRQLTMVQDTVSMFREQRDAKVAECKKVAEENDALRARLAELEGEVQRIWDAAPVTVQLDLPALRDLLIQVKADYSRDAVYSAGMMVKCEEGTQRESRYQTMSEYSEAMIVKLDAMLSKLPKEPADGV